MILTGDFLFSYYSSISPAHRQNYAKSNSALSSVLLGAWTDGWSPVRGKYRTFDRSKLQEHRHLADYDRATNYLRADALRFVDDAVAAIAALAKDQKSW